MPDKDDALLELSRRDLLLSGGIFAAAAAVGASTVEETTEWSMPNGGGAGGTILSPGGLIAIGGTDSEVLSAASADTAVAISERGNVYRLRTGEWRMGELTLLTDVETYSDAEGQIDRFPTIAVTQQGIYLFEGDQ